MRHLFIIHLLFIQLCKSRNIICNIQIYRSIPTISFEEERIDEQWVMGRSNKHTFANNI